MSEQHVTHNDLEQLKSSIESSLEKMESRIMAFLANDREHIKEDLNQHREWHKQHFEKSDKITEKLTDTKENLEKQITESRVSVTTEVRSDSEKQDNIINSLSKRVTIIESTAQGKHSQIAMIISIVGVLAAVGAVIMVL